MNDRSNGCLESFLVTVFILLMIVSAYSSYQTYIDINYRETIITFNEESIALGGHSNCDLSALRKENDNLKQKQMVWNIVLVAALCALIITLIVFVKSPKSKTVENEQIPKDAGSRLEELNNLLKNELISQDEYEEKKKEILKTL